MEVVGFDYRAQTPWEAKQEFPSFFRTLRDRCGHLTLIANSIGAFFSLSSLSQTLVDEAFLISPVVDMRQLIENMMQWAGVTEHELAEKQEIPTQFGETLSMQYLRYVREHPIAWHMGVSRRTASVSADKHNIVPLCVLINIPGKKKSLNQFRVETSAFAKILNCSVGCSVVQGQVKLCGRCCAGFGLPLGVFAGQELDGNVELRLM